MDTLLFMPVLFSLDVGLIRVVIFLFHFRVLLLTFMFGLSMLLGTWYDALTSQYGEPQLPTTAFHDFAVLNDSSSIDEL